MPERTDAVVVGAGPNGLAAAIALAREGRSVLLLEAEETVGGGLRTDEGTLPGFRHDVCSAIHPLAAGSPFLGELPLEEHGLEWIHPDVPLAHPLDGGTAALLRRSTQETAAGLGPDGEAWRRLFDPLVEDWPTIRDQFLGPVRLPRRPFAIARFGLLALRSAAGLASSRFEGELAPALFGGMAAHGFLPLDGPTSAGFGVILGTVGHAIGWPMARGGSQAIADAMAAHLRSLGGEIVTGHRVTSLDDIPPTRIAILDLTPAQVLRIAGEELRGSRARQLARFRYGPGVFKVDYALDGPVPWTAPEATRAGTVHLGGTLRELVRAEGAVVRGRHPEAPYVLVAQQSTFDESRAPEGRQTLWAYCHVPNGSTVDMTGPIERQIERFAPGFRDLILERRTITAAGYERHDENFVGGDISGGANDGLQLLMRPRIGLDPYFVAPARAGRPELFICSSSTPPGGGVHGMSGFHAVRFAIAREERRSG